MPLDYPSSLPLKVLERTHPMYQVTAPALTTIDDLVAGGYQIEARKNKYLKARPGEDPKLYEIRLERFTYTNILGDAIAKQVAKLGTGSINLSGVENPFWEEFREKNSPKGRDEKDLITESFRIAMQFGRCYWHVDKPIYDGELVNRLQEELAGIRPYVCVYSPLEVILWHEEEDGLKWLKTRQVETKPNPFGETLSQVCWTFIDDTYVAKYEAYVKLNKKGGIEEILNKDGEVIGSGEDAKVQIERSPTPHGLGKIPVICLDLPHDLWLTNQAYLKALEHLNLENSRYDTAMMAGYVQRTYRPYTTPDSDLDSTFVDAEDEVKSSNAHILRVDSFSFNEATGSSIASVSTVMEECRRTINEMVGLARASATQEAVQQSGVSKKMDFVIQELILRSYGQILCTAYQDLLQLVGKAAGLDTENLSVTGLNSFDVDSLESTLAIAVELEAVIMNLPPTALKLFYQQFASLLVPNASADQQAEIKDEIEEVFQKKADLQVKVEAVQMAQLDSEADPKNNEKKGQISPPQKRPQPVGA
jgi:hypothetical protein